MKKFVNYLFEAVSLLGEMTVRDISFRYGLRPKQLLTDFDIHNVNGFKVLTPAKTKVPLELIALSSSIPNTLKQMGLSLTYLGPNAMVFEYAQR